MAKYLYNGVELPALPEWDKETYPYAMIYIYNTVAVFIATPSISYFMNDSGEWRFDLSGITHLKKTLYSYEDATEWGAPTTVTPETSSFPVKYVVWANHDILNEDGTLYLSASEPIPVPTFTLDRLSFLQGWLLGRRIASNRSDLTDAVLEDGILLINNARVKLSDDILEVL